MKQARALSCICAAFFCAVADGRHKSFWKSLSIRPLLSLSRSRSLSLYRSVSLSVCYALCFAAVAVQSVGSRLLCTPLQELLDAVAVSAAVGVAVAVAAQFHVFRLQHMYVAVGSVGVAVATAAAKCCNFAAYPGNYVSSGSSSSSSRQDDDYCNAVAMNKAANQNKTK